MSRLFDQTISNVDKNLTVAGGLIADSGDVFRFQSDGQRATLFVFPSYPKYEDIESFEDFDEDYPADQRFCILERTLGAYSFEALLEDVLLRYRSGGVPRSEPAVLRGRAQVNAERVEQLRDARLRRRARKQQVARRAECNSQEIRGGGFCFDGLIAFLRGG